MNPIKLGILVSMTDRFSDPSNKIKGVISGMADSFGKKMHAMSDWIDKTADKFNKFETDLSKKRENLDKFYLKVAATGYGMSKFGSGIIAAAGKPINEFKDLEDGVTNLRVAMMQADGSISPAFDKISKQATDLSNKLPTTAREMHNVAALGLKMGMSENAMYGGSLEAASKFAMVAMDRNFERSMEMANEVQKAWSIDPAKMTETLDLMAKAKGAGVDPEEMNRMIMKTGGTAQALGNTGYEALAAKIPYFALLKNKTGAQGETLGTNVSLLETRAMDAKKAAEVKKETGVQLNFTDKQGKYLGFENLVKEFEKLRGLSDTKRTAVISKMFGESAEITSIVNILAKEGTDGAEAMLKRMNAQASLDKKMDEMNKNFSAKLEAAVGTWDTSVAKFGNLYADPLKNVADKMNSVAEAAGNLSENSPILAKTLGWITLGVGGAAYGGGKLLMMLAGFGMAWPYAKKGLELMTLNTGKFGEMLTMHGKLSGLQVGILAAGAAAWMYVLSEFADESSIVGNDFRVATDSAEGFGLVLTKISAGLKTAGSYLNPLMWGKDGDEARAKYLQDAYDAEVKLDDIAKNKKLGRYSESAVQKAALSPENVQKKMEEAIAGIPMAGTQSLSFNPSIKIEGGSNLTEEQIRKIMDEQQKKFWEKAEALKKRELQLAYGAK